MIRKILYIFTFIVLFFSNAFSEIVKEFKSSRSQFNVFSRAVPRPHLFQLVDDLVPKLTTLGPSLEPSWKQNGTQKCLSSTKDSKILGRQSHPRAAFWPTSRESPEVPLGTGLIDLGIIWDKLFTDFGT